MSDSATPWTAARQASLSFTISSSLLRFMSIEWVMLSNHLILCCPLLLLPSILPSISVFYYESAIPIRWPKYWHFSFSISPSNEQSGLISFWIDWFYLLEEQGTLKESSSAHIWKDPDAGKDWRQEKGTKDEMVGWHHQLNGHEFE